MGNYDGAEICKLFGVYILSHLETIINKNEIFLSFVASIIYLVIYGNR